MSYLRFSEANQSRKVFAPEYVAWPPQTMTSKTLALKKSLYLHQVEQKLRRKEQWNPVSGKVRVNLRLPFSLRTRGSNLLRLYLKWGHLEVLQRNGKRRRFPSDAEGRKALRSLANHKGRLQYCHLAREDWLKWKNMSFDKRHLNDWMVCKNIYANTSKVISKKWWVTFHKNHEWGVIIGFFSGCY